MSKFQNNEEKKSIEQLRKLLGLGGSFYINFLLDERDDLEEAIKLSAGFKLIAVYKHPNKNRTGLFVLEIQCLYPRNKNLQINELYLFTINNAKRRSPNLIDPISIEEFEKKYGNLGRPKQVNFDLGKN